MSMNSLENVCALTDKIALELVFAEPGKDGGLLPINSLLGEIENIYAANPAPEAVQQAIAAARQWVDAAFEAGGFAADMIKRLGVWACWMRQALTPCQAGQPLPALPEELTTPLSAPPVRVAVPSVRLVPWTVPVAVTALPENAPVELIEATTASVV